jgi:(1->4)-alpha-D-glucan 1-alpha-D-glucosylmutase
VHDYVAGTLADPEFRARLLRFCRRIEPYAACKALGQLTLKLCSPGIPDIYQGSELWHQPLVDPDNRRPVDYEALQATLATLNQRPADDPGRFLSELKASYTDGRLKAFVLSRLLRLRAENPSLFQSSYTPLDSGENCVAFGRGSSGAELLCAVARFPFRVTRGRAPWPVGNCWGAQELTGEAMQGRYRDVFTGRTFDAAGKLTLSELFRDLPIAVLTR